MFATAPDLSIKSLYDPASETENCGVGMVASLYKTPSRRVVADADEMLVRMSHRGGCGCDPNSGDGAGIMVGMPDSFMRSIAEKEFNYTLPPADEYCVGNVFFPRDPAKQEAAKKTMDTMIKRAGLSLVGWRPVPVDNTMLGKDPLDSEPYTEQVFIVNDGGAKKKPLEYKKFERELMRLRCLTEKETATMEGFYINSLTSQTITYKGQLTPEQVSSSRFARTGRPCSHCTCVPFLTPPPPSRSCLTSRICPTPPSSRTWPSSTPASPPTPSPPGSALNPFV